MTTPIEPDASPSGGSTLEQLRYQKRFVEVDVPLGVRAIQALDIAIAVAFANPLMRLLIDLAAMALLVIAVTSQARSAVDEPWFTAVVIVLVILPLLAVMWQSGRILLSLARLEQGAPAFGALGGLGKHLLRVTVKTSKAFRLELSPEDSALMTRFASLAQAVDEAILRKQFFELERPAEPADDDALEREWRAIWEKEILTYRVGDATMRDTYNPESPAAAIIPFRLIGVTTLIAGMILAFQIALLFLSFRATTGGGSWVTVFQVCLVGSFLLTSIIYWNHVTSLRLIEIQPTADAVVESIPADVRDDLDELTGARIVPIRVITTPSYFSAIRDYFAGSITVSTVYNAVLGLVLIAIALTAAIAVAPGSRSTIVSEYGELAIAFVAIPFAIVASFYTASLLIEHFRSLTGALLGGLVTGLVPLLLSWLVRGDVPSNSATIIAAAITGLIGTFATALGTHLKDRLGSPARQTEPATA